MHNQDFTSPEYYTVGKIEVWDFISDQKLDYDKGCAVKYICRAGKKEGNLYVDDLHKAINYLQHAIDRYEQNGCK